MFNDSHNPYFNRWFSAIKNVLGKRILPCSVTILILIDGFLQYAEEDILEIGGTSHNPYFNRWFSAIYKAGTNHYNNGVTILILIDGFLQYFRFLRLGESLI